MKKHFEKSLKSAKNWHGRGNNPKLTRKVLSNQLRDEEKADNLPTFQPLKGKIQSDKHFDIHIAPLRRYLISNVGKHWNDIYSEISKEFSHNKRRGGLWYLKWMVEFETRLNPTSNEVEMFWAKNYIPVTKLSEIYTGSRDILYIHPETKILCKVPRHKKVKTYNWRWFFDRTNNLIMYYLDHNNLWWCYEFERLKTNRYFQDLYDVKPHHKTGAICLGYFEYTFYDIYYSTNPTVSRLKEFWGSSKRSYNKYQLSASMIRNLELDSLKKEADKYYRKNPRDPASEVRKK